MIDLCFVTYLFFPALGLQLLLSDHLFYAAVFYVFLFSLHRYDFCVFSRLLLQSLRLLGLSHRLRVVLSMDRVPRALSRVEIGREPLLLVFLPLPPQVVFAAPTLLISLPDVHDLLRLALSLFDLFPGLLLLQLEEGYPVGEQPGIFGRLLLAVPHGDQGAGDLLLLLPIIILLVLFVATVLHASVVSVVSPLTCILFFWFLCLRQWMGLGLWHRLRLLR